jgi:hypothetical protein
MLGRAQPEQVEVKYEAGKQLTSRFENMQRTQQEFLRRWIEEVFPKMLKQNKWMRDKKDLKVGDIVGLTGCCFILPEYKYARIESSEGCGYRVQTPRGGDPQDNHATYSQVSDGPAG